MTISAGASLRTMAQKTHLPPSALSLGSRSTSRTMAPFLVNGFALLAVIGERADDDPTRRGVHVDDDVRVAREEDIRAAVVRRDDQHVVGSRLHQVGNLAQPLPALVKNLEPDHLKQKVLVGGEGAGIGAPDPQRRAAEPLDSLGSRNALNADQC